MDSIWCGFGAALVSIRIQFGLVLDLNWVTINMLTCFIWFWRAFGLSLDSDWIQFGFGFVLVWDWIDARPFSNKPFAMNFLFTHAFLFMLLMEEFVLGTSHQSDYGMDELLKTAFYQYLLMIMVNGFNKTCPGMAIQMKACWKMPIQADKLL